MNKINSCTGNSRHRNIIYVFIKYLAEKGEIIIMHCPTHLMLDHYFTKPLQGSLFYKFRDKIIGIVSTYTLLEEIVSYSSKEHVGKQIPLKEIQSKTGGLFKEKEMLEDKK